MIWLGTGQAAPTPRPSRHKQTTTDLAAVGLVEVSGGAGGRSAVKKLRHNRFGRTLGNLVIAFLRLGQSLLALSSLYLPIYPSDLTSCFPQETPQLPSYLSPAGAGRTVYRSSEWSLKRIKGVFAKGHKDGVFNGWPGAWSLPAVPTDTCYHEEPGAQMLAVHVYTVGFFMGAAEGATEADVGPGVEVPNPADAGYHRRIAEASVFSVYLGQFTSSGLT